MNIQKAPIFILAGLTLALNSCKDEGKHEVEKAQKSKNESYQESKKSLKKTQDDLNKYGGGL